MSKLRFILASLIHHGRTNMAVGFGVMAATAVLTGALLVGDSMQGSLRDLTLDRLENIDQALVTQQFFDAGLADKAKDFQLFRGHFSAAVPAIVLQVSFENADSDPPLRANRVTLIGCDDRFSELGPGGPVGAVEEGQVVLNSVLAKELGIDGSGKQVLLRLPRITAIPADSPLGRKDETIQRSRLTVGDVIPTEGLGRFSMRPSQALPKLAFVSLAWLQNRLDQGGKASAIFVAGRQPSQAAPPQADAILADTFAPTPADLGISIIKTELGYFNVSSRQMMLAHPVETELTRAMSDRTVQPALTYLANAIALDHRQIPYSTVTALDFADSPPLGPFVDREGKPVAPLGEGEIALNSWAADDLKAKLGDVIRVRYFEPESTHGEVKETETKLRLAAIVALEGAAADPDFTPEVEGVTDQLSIADWDPPFPFDARAIRDQDETYWDEHRATPKAFVSLPTGRKLWGSRFGDTTTLRVVPRGQESLQSLEADLAVDPLPFGFRFQPLKRQGLAASQGATPFHILFIAFSFFVIAAALMLVVLLFRLGIEQRAESIGILQAVGLTRQSIAGLLAVEGLLVAAIAALAGSALGIGYAALMLAGLRTWWLAAVVTPFLRLHVSETSLIVGYASGLVVCFASILWALWRSRRTSIARLLAGQFDGDSTLVSRKRSWTRWLAPAMLLAAVVLAVATGGFREEVRAAAFFGVGALVLAAGLLFVRRRLRDQATGPAVAIGRGNLMRLTLRSAARNPGRSTLSVGLIASTSFLIVAISAFHLDPTQQEPRLDSGNGGFALVAESDQPILFDVNTEDGRFDLSFSDEDSDLLASTKTYGLRVQGGDDASCLNLYQARQPRILGLPENLLQRGGFAWASTAAKTPEEKADPWLLLEKPLPPDADGTPCVPVVMDANTAMYALHLTGGVGQTYDIRDDRDQTVRLRIVGLLGNSILQGDLLVAESRLLEHFPHISGRRFFLVECDPEKTAAVAAAWNRTLGDFGLATETTGQRLARFLAVQNTYLSTFQSLGGLGLLLGTFGLAAVQLRNVLERRRELALLRAVGFRRATLGCLVLLENALLLLAGLGCGVVAAAVAVLPHLLSGSAAVPFQSVGAILLAILVVGLLASLLAVRATLRAPLIAALRGQ
ncbi:MAG: ABC transporter permease [Planctomycetaceae bacterium]|nr:ABC transporter permease [Planctomycetaceae bacterium]